MINNKIMKEFKITEEQIKENKDLTLKEYFKEVFETKLEVGKWYKYKYIPNQIVFFETDENGAYGDNGYGVDYKECWHFYASWTFINNPNDWELATEKEVFNALKKEAEKRGFVKGNKVKDNGLESSCGENEILKDNTFCFDFVDNEMWMKVGKNNYNCLIFENGKWAEIISQPEEVIELNGVKYKKV